MTAVRYSKAPITEAIIDLRIKPSANSSLQAVETASTREASAYPEVHKLAIARGQLEVGERVSASAVQEQTGLSRVSSDKRQVFQARIDGFTFSRLAPYESWEPFRNEAQRLWSGYREIVRPTEITRLAVRYINRFDLPGTRVELKEYFRTGPEISADLPQAMNGFFLRLLLPQEDLQGQVIINETIVPPAQPNSVSVVLDIDLFRDQAIPQDEEWIWNYLELLRDRKDLIFNACMTDRAKELIR